MSKPALFVFCGLLLGASARAAEPARAPAGKSAPGRTAPSSERAPAGERRQGARERSPEASAAADRPAPGRRAGGVQSTQVQLEDGRKVRAYSFGALDLEGKLKTPQLLYFLGRVRVELDSTTQHRRSFINELKETADERGL